MTRALWLVLTLLAGCFTDTPKPQLVRAGVELRKAETYEAPDPEQGTVVVVPGDFIFTAGTMRVVIGGLRREPEARGALLEATLGGVSALQSVALLSPRVYVDGVAYPVRIERLFMMERAGSPTLRAEGVVVLSDRVIQVARETSLGRAPGTVSTSTRLVTYEPTGERDVRLGARIAWGGPLPFVPGVGEIGDENWHRGPWVGSERTSGSTCFGYAEGSLSVRAVFERRGASSLFLHSEVMQAKGFALARGKSHYEKEVLVIAPSALAAAVRRFGMWRGAPYPELWVHLPYRPQGSHVELQTPEGELLMRGSPDDDGRAVLPYVPPEGEEPGPFIAIATAYGHAASDPYAHPGPPIREPITLQIPRGGRIRVRVRDRKGEPVPARVRLVALEGKPTALGPDHRASGAGDTVITLASELGIDIPSGRYRAIVTHGPEWSLHTQEVEVSETFSPRIDAVLEHEVDPGSWIACDLHLHAQASDDSQVTFEDRLASLAAEGIGFAVPTDHNHVTDYAPTARLLSLDTVVRSLPGVEVTTWDPHFGHFNAYPYPLDTQKPAHGAPNHAILDPATLFRQLHAVDPELVVQVNHPRSEGGIGYFDVMRLDTQTGAADPRYSSEFDALEVYNGFDLARPDTLEQVFVDWLNLLARGQRIAATGSSDSHQVRYQLAGYPRTYAFVPPEAGDDPRAVVRAIRAGESFVTTGPFLEVSIFGGGPGTTVSARDGKVVLAVRVQAPTWMDVNLLEVFVGGPELAYKRTIPTPSGNKRKRVVRLDVADIKLPVERDTFVVVRVSGTTPIDAFFGRANIMPRAFSNPIFIDADGDGETRWALPVRAEPAVPSP